MHVCSVCMYVVYACMYVCMYVCMHVCMYVYIILHTFAASLCIQCFPLFRGPFRAAADGAVPIRSFIWLLDC